MLTSSSAKAIALAYRLGTDAELDGPVARGEQGQVWRLRTSSGTWAVKDSFYSLNLEEARAAAEFQEHLSAHGQPLPRILRDEHGAFVRLIDDEAIRVYEWVDLEEPDALLDPVAVSTALAGIHRTPYPATGPIHPWHTESVGEARWLELLRASEARRAPFAERLADQLADMLAVNEILRPMTPVQLCHLDVWADNFRQTTSGEICVIDWDQAGPADPRRELAMVLFEFGRYDRERLHTLQAAYLEAGGPGPVREPVDFSVCIAQFGHILERHTAMWLAPDATDAVRERALRGIDEILDDPLNLATISLILDAIT